MKESSLPDKHLKDVILEIKRTGFDIEYQGYSAEYMDFNIYKDANGTYKFIQSTH